MPTDSELLRRYAEQHSEEAIAELVRRHLRPVYGVALRTVGGQAHLAQNVTQSVFTELARHAAPLSRHPALAGWLFRSAHFLGAKSLRAEHRRRNHEQAAHLMNELTASAPPEPDWESLRPLLDDLIDELNERDRHALLLRFFEDRTFDEIGVRLNLTKKGAHARVHRALDKLSARLASRGVRSTEAALVAALATQSAVAVPAGLAATVTGATMAVAAGSGTALTFLAYMNAKIIAACAIALVAATTGVVVERKLAKPKPEAPVPVLTQDPTTTRPQNQPNPPPDDPAAENPAVQSLEEILASNNLTAEQRPFYEAMLAKFQSRTPEEWAFADAKDEEMKATVAARGEFVAAVKAGAYLHALPEVIPHHSASHVATAEEIAFAISQIKDKQEGHYGKLFDQLQLSGDDLKRLKANLVQRDTTLATALRTLDSAETVEIRMPPVWDPVAQQVKQGSYFMMAGDRTAFDTMSAAAVAPADGEIHLLLGDEKFKLYEFYQATYPLRNGIVNRLQQELTASAADGKPAGALTPPQEEKLLALLYAANPQPDQGQAAIIDEVLASAKGFLSPAQFAALKQMAQSSAGTAATIAKALGK